MKKTRESRVLSKVLIKSIVLGVMLISVQGCVRSSLDSFCLIYEPVYYPEDTDLQLIEDITDNNLAYMEVCE